MSSLGNQFLYEIQKFNLKKKQIEELMFSFL